jgi:hypothetical protein
MAMPDWAGIFGSWAAVETADPLLWTVGTFFWGRGYPSGLAAGTVSRAPACRYRKPDPGSRELTVPSAVARFGFGLGHRSPEEGSPYHVLGEKNGWKAGFVPTLPPMVRGGDGCRRRAIAVTRAESEQRVWEIFFSQTLFLISLPR